MFRQLSNGDIEFPQQGPPPKEVAGFERDKTNPYLFHLILEQCKFRKTEYVRMPCGKLRACMWCILKHREVNPQFCSTCNEQETP